MKTKILTLSFFMLFATFGFSQLEIKTNPIALLFGQIPLSAEYIINENIGAEATIGYYFSNNTSFSEAISSSGFTTNFLFKYYFNPEDGGDKFYAFPYLRYVKRSSTIDDPSLGELTGTYEAVGLGFGIGFKTIAESGLLFDFGFGVGKNFSAEYTYSNPNYTNDSEINWPVNVLGRVSIGYRF